MPSDLVLKARDCLALSIRENFLGPGNFLHIEGVPKSHQVMYILHSKVLKKLRVWHVVCFSEPCLSL
jgi:hypothetical protein